MDVHADIPADEDGIVGENNTEDCMSGTNNPQPCPEPIPSDIPLERLQGNLNGEVHKFRSCTRIFRRVENRNEH